MFNRFGEQYGLESLSDPIADGNLTAPRRLILKHPAALIALAFCTTGLIAGCGLLQDAPDAAQSPQPDPGESQASASIDPADPYQPLSVNMVAQSGTYFPNGVDGISFGCSDTLVTIDTVPIRADSPQEHVSAAIQFLLDDSQYYHGSPAVTNSLTLSETLELDDVEVNRNDVKIALSGDVVVQGQCEAYRIQAQLYGTAALTAELDDVSITVNGQELNGVLGLEPFDTAQLLDDDANS